MEKLLSLLLFTCLLTLTACAATPGTDACADDLCLRSIYVKNSQGVISFWAHMLTAQGEPISVCPQEPWLGWADGLRDPLTGSQSDRTLVPFSCGADTLNSTQLAFSLGRENSALVALTGLLQSPADAGNLLTITITPPGNPGKSLLFEYVAPKPGEMNRARFVETVASTSP